MAAEPNTDTLPTPSGAAPATRNRRPRGQYPMKADQAVEAVVKKLPELSSPTMSTPSSALHPIPRRDF